MSSGQDRGPLRVGDIVHGYLAGHFGRDHYECSRVEAIGADWAIIRTFDGTAVAGAGARIVAVLEKSRDEQCDDSLCPYRSQL